MAGRLPQRWVAGKGQPHRPALAADHLRVYNSKVGEATLQAQRGNTRGELSIRPVRIK
jgi:hypothetical protein